MTALISSCCHAPVRPFYAGDYNDPVQKSNWYVCNSCHRDCDVVEFTEAWAKAADEMVGLTVKPRLEDK